MSKLPEPEELVVQLKRAGTRTRAVRAKAHFKSDALFFGVPMPSTRTLTAPLRAEFRHRRDLGCALSYAKALWATRVHEPRLAAILIVDACEAFFDDRVWEVGHRWLCEVDNRGHCDGIAPDLLAPFVQTSRPRHRSRRREVLRWTRHLNAWVRRGALLATLRSLRQDRECRFLFDVAGRLLGDPDLQVQKGLGWMIRECADHNPREVIGFIQQHRGVMRRSTITSAVSRLPKTLQRAARNG